MSGFKADFDCVDVMSQLFVNAVPDFLPIGTVSASSSIGEKERDGWSRVQRDTWWPVMQSELSFVHMQASR